MAIPIAALIWTGLAGYGAARTLYRPARAVVEQGRVALCPGMGPGCHPWMSIAADGPVYAVAAGRVVAADATSVSLVPHREAVLLRYENLARVYPAVGAQVGTGEAIGLASSSVAPGGFARGVGFSVFAMVRDAAGKVTLVPYEPASWLAARGLRVASRLGPGGGWCAEGRTLRVPQAILKCGMRLPAPGGLSLLPVSVSVE